MRFPTLLRSFFVFACASSILRAEITISQLYPQAVRPGEATEVTIMGSGFQEPVQVWTSFKANLEIKSIEPAQVKLAITLPNDAVPQWGGIAVKGVDGLSPFIPLMIDNIPSVLDNAANHTIETAQAIPAFVAIDGFSDGKLLDYYRFKAVANQRVAIDVISQRIGSTFDPVIQVFDSQGNVVCRGDDSLLGPDCRLAHIFKEDGEYIIELRDNRYAAGGRYRMRIGDFPLIDFPFPLFSNHQDLGAVHAWQFGGVDSQAAYFERLEDVSVLDLKEQPATPISAKWGDGKGAAWAVVNQTDLRVFSESERNDDPSQADQVEVPCMINGRFDAIDDNDQYSFSVPAGAAYRISGKSFSIGTPSSVQLALFNAAGAQVAATSISDADEWFFDYTFPEAGTYRLQVSELLRRGGSEFAYAVEIAAISRVLVQLKPDAATRDKFLVPATLGGFTVDLQVDRVNYNGPVELSIPLSVEGLDVINPVVPEGASSHRLQFQTNSDWNQDTLLCMRLIAKPADNNIPESLVRSVGLNRVRSPHVPYPPTWSDGLILVGGVASPAPFFTLSTSTVPQFFNAEQAEHSCYLTLHRLSPEFKEAVNLRAVDFPAGWTLSVRVENDMYALTITRPEGDVAKPNRLTVVAYGDFQQRGVYQSFDIPISWDSF